MGKHWAIVQHAAFEGPGVIAAALAERGWAHRVYRTDQGEAVPGLESLAGLVVMGGPMGVYEADRYPYLSAERTRMAEAVAAGIPVLGVCLGAQLLAAALGAEVAPGPVLEVGEGEVRLTEAGRRDPVLGADGTDTLPVVHWHRDTFPLPAGTERLASSGLYPQQAFRAGRTAYGLQFHCELDEALAAAWRPHFPAGVSLSDEHLRRVMAAGRSLIERFLHFSAGVHNQNPAQN